MRNCIKLALLNIVPFILWMANFYIFLNSFVIADLPFIAIPLLEFAATIMAGSLDIKQCNNLKTFNLMGLLLALSAVGGCYLEGQLYYKHISSDWATPVVSLLYLIIFSITVAIILIVGNTVIVRRNKKS